MKKYSSALTHPGRRKVASIFRRINQASQTRFRRTRSGKLTALIMAGVLVPGLLLSANRLFVRADNSAQTLPFSQNWTNAGLITANDNWSGVPGIEGYLGQDITTSTGVDPQTLLGVS